jgi:hypothetical protein
MRVEITAQDQYGARFKKMRRIESLETQQKEHDNE